jgi:ammonium transporter Rh
VLGTVFLWLYWPSFNSALAPGDDQHRAVLNTYLALTSCCVVTYAISSLTDEKGRWDMVYYYAELQK